MSRHLVLAWVGAALLLCAGLLAMTASESQASARALTKACIEAANAKSQWDNAATISASQDLKRVAEVRRCTEVQRWDMGLIKAAGFIAACGAGFLASAFGFFRPKPDETDEADAQMIRAAVD